MEIGLFVPLGNMSPGPEYVQRLGLEAEQRGVESIWLGEHVVLFDEYGSSYPYSDDGRIPAPPGTGMLEPFVALSYLAASTERLRLGTGICIVPQRNPLYTAKQVADLDWLSRGRAELGAGVGWLREEFEALQVPWEGRGRRADEHLEVMRSLWTRDVSSYEGETYTLPPSRMYPKPVQEPHPRIHVGGESDAALARTARLGQGWFGFGLEPDRVPERLEVLDRHLGEHGRARGDVQISIGSYLHGISPDLVERYAEAGVDRVVALFLAPTTEGLPAAFEDLAPSIEAARRVSARA